MTRRLALAAALLLCIVALAAPVHALDNGLALTPQMGYNTWYDLMCSSYMNETTIRRTADALIDLGLAALGYRYINLDDCWSEGRLPNGTQYAQQDTFPSGIAALADYVHSKGLLFGVYTDRGDKTCAGRPGAAGWEKIDAQTYADWGVDYLKEDSCNASQDHQTAFDEYGFMRDALNATGRPIFFSLCGWYPWYAPEGASLGNSWRTGPDDTNWHGVLSNIDIMAQYNLSQYAGPGGINDPCMLLSNDYQGNKAMTENQTRAQFSQWAVMASPLLISGSLLEISDYNLETYSNEEVIAVNQDPAVKQGVLLVSEGADTLALGAAQIWARELVDGSWAVHFLNAGNNSVDLTCDASCFSAMMAGGPWGSGWEVKVRDLWAHADVAIVAEPLFQVSQLAPQGGSALFKFTWQPASPDAQPGPETPGDPHSTIELDPTIQPRNHSTIPGYEKYVEQCGEFVYRYFHTVGKNYPTMGQPYYFLLSGLDEKNQSHPAFHRILNNGTMPPKAGDILVAKGPASGEFHTALIQSVRGSSVTIFQANVAWDWEAPGKFLYARLPLEYNFDTSTYYMPDLPTSKFGYNHDFFVAGWIHPTGDENALPGTPP